MPRQQRWRNERRSELKRDVARTLRSTLTEHERKLWHCLRDKRFEGLKFRRQQPIGPFVAGFYCASAKLIVELDGSQHANERAEYDRQRTKWFASKGYRVLRFWNSDLQDSDYVLGVISHAVRQMRTLADDPSPKFGSRQISTLPQGEG